MQFSPFELLYGRSVCGAMEVLRDLMTKENTDTEVKTTCFVSRFNDNGYQVKVKGKVMSYLVNM